MVLTSLLMIILEVLLMKVEYLWSAISTFLVTVIVFLLAVASKVLTTIVASKILSTLITLIISTVVPTVDIFLLLVKVD